jgi:imidazolonepropionase-like amidohydrolase
MGTVEVGRDADLVLLDADPIKDSKKPARDRGCRPSWKP